MPNSTIKYCTHCGNPMVKEGICEFCKTQDGWVDKGKNPHGIRSGCFPAGTRILTPFGRQAIETLTLDSSILCWRESTRELIEGRVLALKTHKPSIITSLMLSSGAQLLTTEAHSVLTPRGWRKVSRLKNNDTILTVFGAERVTNIDESAKSKPVFNLVTWPDNTFVAGGVIAHNFTHFKRAKGIFWSFKKFIRDLERRATTTDVAARH